MKIRHSASPRNRSSLSSRSPVTGSLIAGSDDSGGAGAIGSAAAASGGPAIRSAMDVIGHRSRAGRLYALASQQNSIGTRVASKVTNRLVPWPAALGRNYVETTIGIGAEKVSAPGAADDWFRPDFSI